MRRVLGSCKRTTLGLLCQYLNVGIWINSFHSCKETAGEWLCSVTAALGTEVLEVIQRMQGNTHKKAPLHEQGFLGIAIALPG